MSVTSKGYGGDVSLILGLTKEGAVRRISFTELNETAGLGMKAKEPAFRDQFEGKAEYVTMIKGAASGEHEISAISGASITSTAVTNAVNAGLDFYRTVMEGGN